MKTIVAWALLCWSAIDLFSAPPTKISVKDAIDKRMVAASVKSQAGNSGSTHIGECIILKLKNLTATELVITVEPGRRLAPFYEGSQTLIVTQPIMVQL